MYLTKYKNRLERFFSSERGQRFFNFAYCIGAAIVILGALFKITYIRGGDTLLIIGMGTEVLIFILNAFDRPSRDYNWEYVFPELDAKDPENRTESGAVSPTVGKLRGSVPTVTGAMPAGNVVAQGAMPAVNFNDGETISEITQQFKQIADTTKRINDMSASLLESFSGIIERSGSIGASSSGYAEQMEQLTRNIAGLNTIYEIQLKSISSQLDSIERVNCGIKDIRDMYEKSAAQSTKYCEETEKMARHIEQLNKVYENMLYAMTVNMHGPLNRPVTTAEGRNASEG